LLFVIAGARNVFASVQERALLDGGVRLGPEFLLRLIGELSGLGPLLEFIARPDAEDIAINLGHLYVYTTGTGWQPAGSGAARGRGCPAGAHRSGRAAWADPGSSHRRRHAAGGRSQR
jgi:hypothetical protein